MEGPPEQSCCRIPEQVPPTHLTASGLVFGEWLSVGKGYRGFLERRERSEEGLSFYTSVSRRVFSP